MISVSDFLQRHKIEFRESGQHHHAGQGWIQIRCCPHCGSDNFHLGVNLRNLCFYCWKCGLQSAGKTLAALGISGPDIRSFFDDVRKERPVIDRTPRQLVEPQRRGPLLQAHCDYLRSRGFSPKALQKTWQIEGIGIAPKLAWRIYIPVYQSHVRVSWTTRAIGNTEQRYLSAPAASEALPHKHCLYGIDYVSHSVVVVEGPIDVWRIGPGAVALFGTAYTTAQVSKLSRIPFRYILFDNEPRAQAQAKALAKDLSCFPGETYLLYCDAKDPGEMSDTDVSLLRKTCMLP